MHTYIRIFLNLLLPLTLLFTAISVGYFTLDYSFYKAFNLSILSGVLAGVSISSIMAFVLLMLRKLPKREKVQKTEKTEKTEKTKTPAPIETEAAPIPKVAKIKRTPRKGKPFTKEIKCMLLMDKELTFDVILNALKKENGCSLSKGDPKKGTMTIQTKEDNIHATITSLTQHTSQIILLTGYNAKYIKRLISLIKEKEHSFLQY
ncbi:MAG: hypothetical protein DRG09_03360 [Epsilonproteobacteria bacterium]|nr:MAG: hypothetical protein DRG09_03360 [Campylobacterota bacterium]